jgi:hypothetical protein
MKFTIDVDCTPDEARQFLGLPDVQEFQSAMMALVQERMTEQVKSMDPEALMSTWLPTGMQAWENMQESFMKGFSGAAGGTTKK